MNLTILNRTDIAKISTDPKVIQGIESLFTAVFGLTNLGALGNYPNDTVAGANGVEMNGLYRNGSVLMVRVA